MRLLGEPVPWDDVCPVEHNTGTTFTNVARIQPPKIFSAFLMYLLVSFDAGAIQENPLEGGC